MECNRYKPLASAFWVEGQRINSLTAYLNEFLRMFMVKMQSRRLQLSVLVDFGIEVEQQCRSICTDLNVFNSILFHLVSNAVKYSDEDSKIEILVSFKPLLISTNNLTGYLVVSIKD
jgi:signal transduction histidine kinase